MKTTYFLTILFLFVFVGIAAAQTPTEIEDELLAHFKTLNAASSYGSDSDVDVQDRENKAILDALLKYAKRADVLNFVFPRLSKEMTIRTSKDKNFRAYSWDCECGGTMHDFYNVIQYRAGGKVNSWAETTSDDTDEGGAGSFIHDIFQMPAGGATIYITVSTFRASTSLNGQSIDIWRINGGGLQPRAKLIKTKEGLTDSISFAYDFFSVVDHPERPVRLVFFDEKTRSFKFPVVIEDDETPQGRVTNKFITYKFNGKYFVKTN
jgi:hypothetical protein